MKTLKEIFQMDEFYLEEKLKQTQSIEGAIESIFDEKQTKINKIEKINLVVDNLVIDFLNLKNEIENSNIGFFKN